MERIFSIHQHNVDSRSPRSLGRLNGNPNMSNIELKEEGQRVYVLGNTFPIKDAIKSAGGHWDADRKAWWIGKKKKSELEASIGKVAGGSQHAQGERQEPGEDAAVAGRAEYKGRTYYLAGRVEKGRTHWDNTVAPILTRDQSKYLLYSRDGKMQFWAAYSMVTVSKRYSKAQTIRSLREYMEDRKAEQKDGAEPITREAKMQHLDMLDQCDEFDEAARYARANGLQY